MRFELRVNARHYSKRHISPRSFEKEKDRILGMCHDHQMQYPVSQSPKRIKVSPKKRQQIFDRLHSDSPVRKLSFRSRETQSQQSIKTGGKSKRVWRPSSRLKPFSEATMYMPPPRPKSHSVRTRRAKNSKMLSSASAIDILSRPKTVLHLSSKRKKSPLQTLEVATKPRTYAKKLATMATPSASKLFRHGEDPTMIYHSDLTPPWHAMFESNRRKTRLSMLESVTCTHERFRQPSILTRTQKTFGERLELHCKDMKMSSLKVPSLVFKQEDFRN